MIIIEICPECGHDLKDIEICTFPPIRRKECPYCGWYWEDKTEEVIRIPLQPNGTKIYQRRYHPLPPSDVNYNYSCEFCNKNPKNGGDGICFCILGTPDIKM